VVVSWLLCEGGSGFLVLQDDGVCGAGNLLNTFTDKQIYGLSNDHGFATSIHLLKGCLPVPLQF
jgi:hypothetical protein